MYIYTHIPIYTCKYRYTDTHRHTDTHTHTHTHTRQYQNAQVSFVEIYNEVLRDLLSLGKAEQIKLEIKHVEQADGSKIAQVHTVVLKIYTMHLCIYDMYVYIIYEVTWAVLC